MFILSAFADEIDPDPQKQVDMLKQCGIAHIELRSILGTNILDLNEQQLKDLKSVLDQNGIGLSALGSPIGKVRIDEPFGPHLERFRHALELCRVFGTPNMRVFSYYPPENGNIVEHRQAVIDRMVEKAELAKKAGVRLLHENEHRIYGEDPARVVDLMESVREQVSDAPLFAVYDPANYVFGGHDPWMGWQMTRGWTVHFHIKDWVAGERHGRVAGEGQGRIPEVIADAVESGYDGFATLEPHLLGGDHKGGATGPELFPKAVEAFKGILERAGAQYR